MAVMRLCLAERRATRRARIASTARCEPSLLPSPGPTEQRGRQRPRPPGQTCGGCVAAAAARQLYMESGDEPIWRFIIELDGRGVGEIQYWHPHRRPDWTWSTGVDIFIGERDARNRGTGTEAVRTMLRYLFETKSCHRVTIDPHTGNARAIRCYEKAGFPLRGRVARQRAHRRPVRRHSLHVDARGRVAGREVAVGGGAGRPRLARGRRPLLPAPLDSPDLASLLPLLMKDRVVDVVCPVARAVDARETEDAFARHADLLHHAP